MTCKCADGIKVFGQGFKCGQCVMRESNIKEWPCICDMIQVFKPGVKCFACLNNLNYKTNARVL